MSTITPAEKQEAQELIDRAMKLSLAVRKEIAIELLQDDELSSGELEASKQAWKAELQRRIAAINDGSMKTYSIEETMAHLWQSLAERSSR